MNKKIYFDYAATTPVDERVLKKMLPYFTEIYGNSSSMHSFGDDASMAIDESRKYLAQFIGASSKEIVFTGSATEANNMVLKGVMNVNKEKGNHLIISAIEHDCVMNSAKFLKKNGFDLTILGVDKDGLINIEELKNSINKETVLVSIMHANNEIGVIQDIGRIGEVCRERGVLFHTDAVQSFGKERINVIDQNIDFLTASAHKIYGPKGIAMLYIKKGIKIEPLLHGGGQENGLRSSTVNTAGIIGMAEATRICEEEMNNKQLLDKRKNMRDRLIDGILNSIEGSYLNGSRERRLLGNVNVSFDNIEGEAILFELNDYGIAGSTGSACSSNSLDPSHVIMALGAGVAKSHSSMRFSVGRYTSEEDISYLLEVLPKAIKRIRDISPFK